MPPPQSSTPVPVPAPAASPKSVASPAGGLTTKHTAAERHPQGQRLPLNSITSVSSIWGDFVMAGLDPQVGSESVLRRGWIFWRALCPREKIRPRLATLHRTWPERRSGRGEMEVREHDRLRVTFPLRIAARFPPVGAPWKTHFLEKRRRRSAARGRNERKAR